MTHPFRNYHLSTATTVTVDGWLAASLLVRDEETVLTTQHLKEHLGAVYARLLERLGELAAQGSAPAYRDERELRFLLDELIEVLHRLDERTE